MYSQPPPYGMDPTYNHPMITNPQWSAPSAPGAYPTGLDANGNGRHNGVGNGTNGVISQQPAPITNVNNNTNNNTSNSSSNVVVNANVNASAGGYGDTYNELLLVGRDLLNRRDWNSGLFSCLNDYLGCVWTCICLPCELGRIANRMGECACVTCFHPTGLGTLRTRLRTMGGIKGTLCSDSILGWLCCCCVACQMKREMDDMKL